MCACVHRFYMSVLLPIGVLVVSCSIPLHLIVLRQAIAKGTYLFR